METGSENNPARIERNYVWSVGNPGDTLTFKPIDSPKYTYPGFLPLASSYSVHIPAELAQFQKNEFMKAFVDGILSHASSEVEGLSDLGEDNGNKDFNSLPLDYFYLSNRLSRFSRFLTPSLQSVLEKVTLDINGAFEMPAINEETFPDLWKTKFFGIDKDSVHVGRRNFPKMRFKFIDKEFTDFSQVIAEGKDKLPDIINDFKESGVVDIFVAKNLSAGEYLKPKVASLLDLVKRDWPNATYAVDINAESWKCPIVTVDDNDKKMHAYNEVVSSYRKQFSKEERQVVAIPRLDEVGLPSVYNEFPGGPAAAEKGYYIFVPGKTPNPDFKKLLSHVVNSWISMAVLDYAMGDDRRAFHAFNDLEAHVVTPEDRKLWQEFVDWIRSQNLRLNFVDPTSLRKNMLYSKSKNSNLN